MKSLRKYAIIILVLFCVLVLSIIYFLNSYKTIYNNQWALKNNSQKINGIRGKSGIDINIDTIKDSYLTGDNILIGIIDSGIYIDPSSDDMSIFVNPAELDNGIDDDKNGYIDDFSGWNFYNNNNNFYSNSLSDYHGTMVKNIIVGNSKDYIGVAQNAKILPLKCFSGIEGDLDDITKAIEYAYKMNVDIINISWDSDINDKELFDIIQSYNDIIFVCSTGNRLRNLNESPVYPASYELDNIITVSAITSTGELFEDTGYGNCVDISAPGENIYCILPENDAMFNNGTSLATAYVTGAVALLLSNYPNLTPSQVKQIIKETATTLNLNKELYGDFGLINVESCLKIAEQYNL